MKAIHQEQASIESLKITTYIRKNRDGPENRNGIETFVNYKWGHYEPVIDIPVPKLPNKCVRVPRNTNYMNIGSVHSAADDVDDGGRNGMSDASVPQRRNFVLH